jgi:hypothetical protein
VQTNEVIGTLVSHLRADLGDILPDNPIVKQAKAVGLSHLRRKVVVKWTAPQKWVLPCFWCRVTVSLYHHELCWIQSV